MSDTHTYEAVGLLLDGSSYAIETIECQSDDEAKELGQRYAGRWQHAVNLFRVPFVYTGHPWAEEQRKFICRIEPAQPPPHFA